MRKRAMLLISIILLQIFAVCPASARNMESVWHKETASEWAFPELEKAWNLELFDVDMPEDFQRDMTRAEFCEILMRMYHNAPYISKEYPDAGFTDIKDKFVDAAYALGVVQGVSETEFAPVASITREQMAVMLCRTAEKMDYSGENGDLSVFSDEGEISPWATDGVAFLFGSGIMKGISETEIAPRGAVTCEQGIVLILRLYQVASGKDVLIYEETPSDYLVELGVVSREDFEKGGEITVYEALKTIHEVGLFLDCSSGFWDDEWYIGTECAPLDYLEEEQIRMLTSLFITQFNGVLQKEEITDLKPEASLTYYDALKYIVRMCGDTSSCSDHTAYKYADEYEVYREAIRKGLIESEDREKGNKPISRNEFYQLLHKGIFTVFICGGYSLTQNRLVDSYIDRKQNEVTKLPEEPKVYKKIEMDVEYEIADDLTISWILPEEYRFLEDINNIRSYRSIKVVDGRNVYDIKREYVIEFLVEAWMNGENTFRVVYDNGDVYYFDIDFSDIRVAYEGELLPAGTYSRNEAYVKMADGWQFEPEYGYMIIEKETAFRLEKMNETEYNYFTVGKPTNVVDMKLKYCEQYEHEVRLTRIVTTKDEAGNHMLILTPLSDAFQRITEQGEYHTLDPYYFFR